MQGNVPEALWKEVEEAFLILPEQGWAKNFCKFVQRELNWDLKTANEFVAWVEPPMDKETLPYMLEQAVQWNLFRSENVAAGKIMQDGYRFKCDVCGVSIFVHHHSREGAIDIAKNMNWVVRGTAQYGPDFCPGCRAQIEVKTGRKMRSDGGPV